MIPRLRTLLAVPALVCAAACPDDSQVTRMRVEKTDATSPMVPATASPAKSKLGAKMGEGSVPTPPRPEGAAKLSWTLPKGWTQELTGGIRYASFKPAKLPPEAADLDIYCVVLPGPAGGELANVNRWRSQIGLAPLDEEGLTEAHKELKTKAGVVSLYDFTSEGQKKSRLVAGLLVTGDSTWFFKMTGEDRAEGAVLPEFTALLQSLQPQATAN